MHKGFERGRGYRGTRKALRIGRCGILNGNALVDDIAFALPFAPLTGIKLVLDVSIVQLVRSMDPNVKTRPAFVVSARVGDIAVAPPLCH